MKKLMVAFAAIASAVAVNAGTVDWTLSNIYASDGSGELASGYNVYFLVDSFTGTGFSGTAYSKTAAQAAGDLSFIAYAVSGDVYGTDNLTDSGYAWDVSAGNNEYGGLFVDNVSAANTVSGYFAVVNADQSMVYFSDVGAIEMSSGTASIDFDAGSSIGTGAWQSVPEPTSGLLLLLGVAGLALRRRRA